MNPQASEQKTTAEGKFQPILVEKKPSLWTRIKNLFRFQLVKKPKQQKADLSLVERDAGGIASAKASPAVAVAVQQEQPAPVQAAAEDNPAPVRAAPQKKKSKAPVVLAACLGFVGLGAVVAAAVLFSGALESPTTEDLLTKANTYMESQKYNKAEKVYVQILEADDAVPQAYLGLAEISLADDKLDEAILGLENGLALTADSEIFHMLQEIDPARQPDEETEQAVQADEAIVWTDKALEGMIREAMDIPTALEIRSSDLRNVTSLKILGSTHISINESFISYSTLGGYVVDGVTYDERGEIRSLEDLRHFPQLRSLVVGYNSIRDIDGLAELTSLETLGLFFNDIDDISAISGMENLRYLYLYNNEIRDLSPVEGLSSLIFLWAQNNQITRLPEMDGLKDLTELYVSGNQISDISPIRGLESLSFFYADNNQISDIAPVQSLDSLTDVSFKENPVADFSPADGIRNVYR